MTACFWQVLYKTCPDTIVPTGLVTIVSWKNTCTYLERTRLSPEHFLRWLVVLLVVLLDGSVS